jgi:predicted helicase
MSRFFSSLYLVDLHGSTKKGEYAPDGIVDQNVFDILPGVAISICVSKPVQHKHHERAVRSFDLWGTRAIKSDWLTNHGLGNVGWNVLTPGPPYYLFVRRQLDFEKEYNAFPSLKEIFPFYGTGIQTSRDGFATDTNRRALDDRLRRFFDLTISDKEVADDFALSDTRGWKIKDVRRSSSLEQVRKSVVQCWFRVFDRRWVALTKDITDWPRLDVMSCVASDRVGLLCSRQQSVSGFQHALVVNGPADMFCLSNKSREGQTLFPLFVQDSEELLRPRHEPAWRPNLGPSFSKGLSAMLSKGAASTMKMTDQAEGNSKRAFEYIYAALHSPTYRRRYVDLLKMDYPRVPLPTDSNLFRELARVGGELVELHLVEASVQRAVSARYDKSAKAWRYDVAKDHHLPVALSFSGPEKPLVGRVSWCDETVWIDAVKPKKSSGGQQIAGTVGFHGVPQDVWNFHIGGYQVCEKWLKDREEALTANDIALYHRIVIALHETIRLMGRVDEIVDSYGGWPGAFVQANA